MPLRLVPASQQVNIKAGQTEQRTARQTVIGYYASNRTYYPDASGTTIGQENYPGESPIQLREKVTEHLRHSGRSKLSVPFYFTELPQLELRRRYYPKKKVMDRGWCLQLCNLS